MYSSDTNKATAPVVWAIPSETLVQIRKADALMATAG
jgi:hypothetical protein